MKGIPNKGPFISYFTNIWSPFLNHFLCITMFTLLGLVTAVEPIWHSLYAYFHVLERSWRTTRRFLSFVSGTASICDTHADMEHQLHLYRSEECNGHQLNCPPTRKQTYFQASTPDEKAPHAPHFQTGNISPIISDGQSMAPRHGSRFPHRVLPLPLSRLKPIEANDLLSFVAQGKDSASHRQHDSERDRYRNEADLLREHFRRSEFVE